MRTIRCWLVLLAVAATFLTQPGMVRAQDSGAGASQQPALQDMESVTPLIDDSEPGVVRLGRVQIAWGQAPVPCASPASVCQVSVRFSQPFVTKPVVTFSNVADYNTQKFAFTAIYLSSLDQESFSARVSLQANIAPLKKVPWMAIGYWR